ncbi:MAG: glycosyltransferase family 4 protein [Acidimicrobiales bacterium]
MAWSRLVVLHHLHDKLWEAFYPAPIDRIGSLVERKIAPLAYRSSTVATLAPSGRTDLINRTPLRADRIHVVRPGINDSFRVESPDHERSATPLLLAVGRLTAAKQFDKAIRVLHAISDHHPGATLTIVGDGPERASLAALIERLGLSERVTLVGRVSDDELRRLYTSAWLLLATSLSEGWGMTLTEAAAAGTPAVATDIIGHRDAMGEGAGVLAHSDEAFASAVRSLLDDPAELAACSKRAFVSSQALSWDRTAAELLQLLVTGSLAPSRTRTRP